MTDTPKRTDLDIAALASSVKAPEALHQRVQAMVDEAHERDRRPQDRRSRRGARAPVPLVRWRLAAALAGSAAAVAAALVVAVVLTGGGASAPTVQQAVALTLRPATSAAPTEDAVHRSQLNVAVEGVAFPYWKERFGWRSAGARQDRVAGRSITTVFYADPQGRRIGYAIVSGRAPSMGGGKVVWHRSIPYHVISEQGATVVTWPRSGHLCVVSGRGVDAGTLLRLAGWSGERAVPA